MNLALVSKGYPPFSFKDVDKDQYIKGLIGFYELGTPGLDVLKNMFRVNYIGTGKEYVSKYKYKENPEAIVYREGIRKVIHDLHVSDTPPETSTLLEKYGVPKTLIDYVLSEAAQVHNGNCTMYGLTPKEIGKSGRDFSGVALSNGDVKI